jgi:hypothetical protein
MGLAFVLKWASLWESAWEFVSAKHLACASDLVCGREYADVRWEFATG